jgi:hypothetical protein
MSTGRFLSENTPTDLLIFLDTFINGHVETTEHDSYQATSGSASHWIEYLAWFRLLVELTNLTQRSKNSLENEKGSISLDATAVET